MNILENIVEQKKKEVLQCKERVPEDVLKQMMHYPRQCLSLKASLTGRPGIIAEFKRKSPSKGWINQDAIVDLIVPGYEAAGASGISILTDDLFFGGKADDLISVRNVVSVPILRKDFIVDDYQVTESKAFGADVILLIAACLSPEQVKGLASKAKTFGLEVLLEIHSEEEINHICNDIDLIGVNNRDLKTFVVDVNRSILLASKISGSKMLISESGLNTIEDILLLKENGFSGFLIGEKFMKDADPVAGCKNLIDQISRHEN